MLKSWSSKLFNLGALTVLVGAFASSQPARADTDAFIEVLIGGARSDRTESRVERLERAVRQLQNRVFYLEEELYTRSNRPRPQRGFVCSLKDDLHGEIFLGRGRTQVEAVAMAQQSCVTRHGFAMWCDGNRPVCDRD
jgi:hypothetical protein